MERLDKTGKVADKTEEMGGMISVLNSRVGLVKAYGKWTVSDVLMTQPPSMAKLRRELGERKVEAAVALLLEGTFKQYLQRVTDEVLLELAAEVVHGDYYYLTLEDVYICLRDLVRHGTAYRLTPALVHKALADYAEVKLSAAERMSDSGHWQHKEARDDRATREAAAEAHRIMLAAYKREMSDE